MTDRQPTADASPTDPRPGGPAAPAVVAVVVTHDPGPWFTDVLRSLAAQTYEQLSVLVVDAASAEDPSPRIAAILPDARIKRLDHDPGYGAAANEVLGLVEGAAFYLLCHDDVALAPTAVQHLVEEAFRTNGGVLGPKLVDWDEPRRLRSVGSSADKTGVPAPFAEAGELDQEQHDAVRDVFAVAGGAILVRADLFTTVGGFDPLMTYFGDDVDLCWRVHVAGARVVIVPAAVARHREALAERRPDLDRRQLEQRHRVRSLLTCYRPLHLARVVPQALLFTAVEAVLAVLGGRFHHAAVLVRAWTWNLRRIPSLLGRRRRIARFRTVRDAEVRHLQVHGSARLTSFLRGQVGPADDRLGALAATGRDLSTALRAPLTRIAVIVAAVVVGLMVVGGRGLLFRSVPAVGELSAFGDSPLDLLRTHLSGWRATGGGGEAASPTGVGAFGLAGLLTFGSMGLARTLLILLLLPAGPVGIWRLTRPIGSIRAGAAAVTVYAALPLPYNALAEGSWSALAAYATVPWILLGLARAMGLAPFGRTDLADEADAVPDTVVTSVPARALGIGLAIALAGLVTPAVVPLVGVVVVGLLVGSLVAGRATGLVRLLLAALGGVGVALVLHLPWTLSLLTDGGGWAAVVGAEAGDQRPFAELLRFQTGPFGNTPLGWAFLAAAALPLVIGRGWRLAWAVRAWFVALAAWGALLAAEQGWLPFDLPPSELVLVPAAAGLALSAALGMAAFEVDLRHYKFGWRQGASMLAALAVVFGALALVPGVVDGRWNLPAGDLNRTLDPVLVADESPDARILWIGARDVLPLGAHTYDGEVALATSDGLPDVTTRWAGARHPSTDRLVADLRLAADRRTAHLGRLLGPEGVRYVVVPTRPVPSSFGGTVHPPPAWLTETLAAQLDLEQVETDPALLVYRNTAWRDMAATAPADVDLPSSPSGAASISPDGWASVVTSTGVGSYGVRVREEGDVVAAVPADGGWKLTVAGRAVERAEAFGWAARYRDPGTGSGTLRYDTPVPHVLLVAIQPLLWAAVLVLRHRFMGRARRRVAAPEVVEPTGPPVDPVASAAAAVAGLAERAERAAAQADEAIDDPDDERARGRRRRRKGTR